MWLPDCEDKVKHWAENMLFKEKSSNLNLTSGNPKNKNLWWSIFFPLFIVEESILDFG